MIFNMLVQLFFFACFLFYFDTQLFILYLKYM